MQERMDADASYRPVVLLEKKYAVYLEAGENALEALQPTERAQPDRGQSQAFADRKFMEDMDARRLLKMRNL